MSITARFLISAAMLASLAAVLVLFSILNAQPVGSGFWFSLALEAQAIQRDLHKQLAGAMRAVGSDGSTAAWWLIVLSFLYGVFHAVGPGHGKVVISTCLLTQESHLRRGVMLSLAAALVQGVTAIVIVEATVSVLGLTFKRAEATATDFEAFSFGLIAFVGAMLVMTRSRRLFARMRQAPVTSHQQLSHAHDHHHHHHNHDEACSDCGHAHGPTRSDIEAPISVRTLVGVILSVGIRPCSGALIVLLGAHAMNLRLAGIGAVLAMSLGTGMTVSLLATLSVYARKASLRLVSVLPDRATRIATAIDVVGVAGGLVILIVGSLLLQSALVVAPHPLR